MSSKYLIWTIHVPIYLWRPRFWTGFFNPKDPVNRVDFGQTTVNLGHHLENITNDPLMTPFGQPWSTLG
jgi:hypothetical protein